MDDAALFEEIQNSDNVEDFSDTKTLIRLLRFSISNQTKTSMNIQSSINNLQQSMSKLENNVEEIDQKTEKVKDRVILLEEHHAIMDQYSRKDVSILTGLEYYDTETPDQMTKAVLGKLNSIYPYPPLTLKDFVAIHRNRKPTAPSNRPPSVTLKFIRHHEKDFFMSKEVKQKLKGMKLNIFHAMCPALIEYQELIKNHSDVKYVFYDGPQRKFVIKLIKSDKFMRYVSSYNDFLKQYKERF